jgi:hypothetical protein
VQHVIGPGVRVELCWDKTGDSGSDLDLHLHRSGTTTAWFGSDTNPNTDDCNFSNCTADTFGTNPYHASPTAWGYTNSPIAACSGTPLGGTWQSAVGACHNPRLDIDNIDDVGKPENINVDAPKNGESFRAMVHYYDCNSYTCVDEHPIVNIYCGGTLLATFGKAPDTLSGFNDGQRWGAGLMWRVADIKANVDGSGTTTGCNITMLHPAGTTSGYWVTNDDTSY